MGIRFYGAVLKYEDVFKKLDLQLLGDYMSLILSNSKMLSELEQTNVSSIDFTRLLNILEFYAANRDELNAIKANPSPKTLINFLSETLIAHYNRLAFTMNSES